MSDGWWHELDHQGGPAAGSRARPGAQERVGSPVPDGEEAEGDGNASGDGARPRVVASTSMPARAGAARPRRLPSSTSAPEVAWEGLALHLRETEGDRLATVTGRPPAEGARRRPEESNGQRPQGDRAKAHEEQKTTSQAPGTGSGGSVLDGLQLIGDRGPLPPPGAPVHLAPHSALLDGTVWERPVYSNDPRLATSVYTDAGEVPLVNPAGLARAAGGDGEPAAGSRDEGKTAGGGTPQPRRRWRRK